MFEYEMTAGAAADDSQQWSNGTEPQWVPMPDYSKWVSSGSTMHSIHLPPPSLPEAAEVIQRMDEIRSRTGQGASVLVAQQFR